MTYYLKWSLEEKPVLGLDFSNSNFNNLFWGKTFIHFQPILLEWVKVAQSCLTLCDPMDCNLPGSSVHGILQARILEWVAVPFSRGSSQPRDPTQISHNAGRFFTVWTTREAPKGRCWGCLLRCLGNKVAVTRIGPLKCPLDRLEVETGLLEPLFTWFPLVSDMPWYG